MIREKTVLAVIPARGGSKGVLRKNIRTVAGKPLIAWTIETAQCSRYIDKLVVSTEDQAIREVAVAWGADAFFFRPDYLAQDDTPAIEVILHTLEQLPQAYDYIMFLQPTSPLRTSADIDAILELCLECGSNASVSVTEAEQSPYWMYTLDGEKTMQPLLTPLENCFRRQDLPSVYVLNGALYVAKTEWLKTVKTFVTPETVAYVMPPERSIDIDTELDMLLADILLTKMNDKRMG